MSHSFDKQYWDERWTHPGHIDSMRTNPPNPHLVSETRDLRPGTALDAGCGAGTEAIWLAGRGWRVTAVDIAADALARAGERAVELDVDGHIRWVQGDLSTWVAETPFDLVTTHYAHPSIPQLDFYDRTASWVAPGGTLLVVGHLHTHDHDQAEHPPSAASVRADDVVVRLDPAEWEIATATEPQRTATGPGGREVTLHDVVVRAVRRH